MIINRRTSFTDLEYPNPFEDPGWTSYDNIPNKTLAIAAAPGQLLSYKVPDGASGWYAMRVVPDVNSQNYVPTEKGGSWSYTYLHEGSVVFLWCNNGSTSVVRKSLGANGLHSVGGAAGIVCGFKQASSISANNYGPYITAKPVKVVNGSQIYRQWTITFSDGRTIQRLTRGGYEWDATSSARSGVFMLIDGKPCYSFEDGASLFGASGATVSDGAQVTYDGIYLGTTPIEFNNSAYTLASGLIVGSSDTNGGAGALGSSDINEGPLLSFGAAPSVPTWGGIANFDFTRNVFESYTRTLRVPVAEQSGAFLYKITEEGHDYSEPYAQKFTAPNSLVDATFEFRINNVPYVFPSVWPDANKQTANSGDYVVYIPGVHIGDVLTVTATYANGTTTGGAYIISMHSLVYGVFLNKVEFIQTEPGAQTIEVPKGLYYTIIHGAGGAGGTNGTKGSSSGTSAAGLGGAGGTGEVYSKIFSTNLLTHINTYVGHAGKTKAHGGNGGSEGHTYSQTGDGGTGGGGGEPSYILANGEWLSAAGGGGGGGGGGAGTGPRIDARYAGGAGSGGGGGYYRMADTTKLRTERDIYISFYTYIRLHAAANQYLEEGTGNSDARCIMGIAAGTEIYLDAVFVTTQDSGSYPGTYTLTVSAIEGNTITFWGDSTEYGHRYDFGTIEIANAVPEQSTPFVSVPGKNGVDGGGWAANAGTAGNTTNFPTLKSGNGGAGFENGRPRYAGGASASGGGASGGSGGGYASNTDWTAGGGGGGGAGGSPKAGGGTGGIGTDRDGAAGAAATNPIQVPLATIDYNEDPVTYGAGVGGLPGMDGNNGWIYIVKIREVSETIDYGALFASGGVSYYDSYTESMVEFGTGHRYLVKQPATVGEKLFRLDWVDTGYTITSVDSASQISATPGYETPYALEMCGFSSGGNNIFAFKSDLDDLASLSASDFPQRIFTKSGWATFQTKENFDNGILTQSGVDYTRNASIDYTDRGTNTWYTWRKGGEAPVEREDYSPATIDETIDCGSVADSTNETKNYGFIIEKE